MIMNLGPNGEKFNVLKHILIAPAGSTIYTKLGDFNSNNNYLDKIDESGYWYITIKKSCNLKVAKNYYETINIACIGGGGGGVSCRRYNDSNGFISGGGGNGGQIKTTAIQTLTKDTIYSLSIGAGGTGGYWNDGTYQGDTANVQPGDGGDTKFGNIITAYGGNKAFCGSIKIGTTINVNNDTVKANIEKNNYDSSTCTGKGGAGIIGTTTSTVSKGGNGQVITWWYEQTHFAAGGGGGAILSSSNNTGGAGGVGGGGNGGTGYTSATFASVQGTAATGYGSGGGGGGQSYATSGNIRPSGGAGKDGVILLRIPKK